jgi:hypothetical protein
MTRAQRYHNRLLSLTGRFFTQYTLAIAQEEAGRLAQARRHKNAAMEAARQLAELLADRHGGNHWTTPRRRTALRELWALT